MIKRFATLFNKKKEPKQEVETQTSLLMKKAGMYKVEQKEECEELEKDVINHSVSVPAPAYLKDDPWFGPAHNLTENQMTVKEAYEHAVKDNQILDESIQQESNNIHQQMYEIASNDWNTVLETQGGSENFQEILNDWSSGKGLH